MIINYKLFYSRNLYNLFLFSSLILFFFSTDHFQTKAFEIKNVEISKPFEMNFNKNDVIDEGFRKSFSEMLSLIVNSSDKKKITRIKLNQIKGMIESFTIKEEKFIDEVYYMNLGVTFNRKKVFKYLNEKNIFPSIPLKKKFLFIPIIINEEKRDLLIFSDNRIYNEWKNYIKTYDLIKYVMPTEDLEDFNIIKKNYENLEEYDFREITDKYFLDKSIVSLIFKNKKDIRVLSRITIKDKVILKNKTFSDINLKNDDEFEFLVNQLKTVYEDYWKNHNQINTSIKLPLIIKLQNLNSVEISKFEKVLIDTDLIYEFKISKFSKDSISYRIIYNGTPNSFLKVMSEKNYFFNTDNKVWTLK